ncbi:uncharacterized protein LOC143521092 isoform X2 [Brachyhypopomus gauderio]|uniref:uncharacterized protein LOC143521092 isoform X2 n=1 Tax=Brachyhypopomus gauderio TaxID=698409 RepID=UPI004041B4CE
MAMKKVMLFFLFMVNLLSCADPQTDLFSVHVPDGFISARLGSSVLLPCTVSPSVDCKSYEVRWYRPDKYNNPVLLYKDLRVQENTGDVQYRNRVSLVGELEKGNVSLQLENLRVEDRGEYVCLVESIQWYDEASMSLNISVIGSHPLLSLADAGDQVNVTCVSDGWSTKAKLTWRDRKGKELNSAEHYKTDSEGLVSVSSWVLFSPSGSDWISCSVGLSEQEMKEIRVVPLKPGFWREAFISSLTLSLTVIITLVVLLVLVKQDLLPRCSSRKNAKIAGKLITYALPVDTEKTTERTLVSDLLPHCSSRKNAKMAANSNESIAEETLPLTEKTKEKTTETTTERTLVSGQSSQSSAPPASDEEKKPKSKKFKKSKDMTSKSQGDLDSVERGKETTTERTLVCGQSSQSSAPPASDEEKKPKSKKFKKSKDMTSKSQGDLDSVERGKEKTTERTLVCGQSSQSSAPSVSDEEKIRKWKKFKKYTVNLTFDPDGVQNPLHMTEDRMAIYSGHLTVESLSKPFLHVLSKEELSSRLQYWEVVLDQQGKCKRSWCVGVTQKPTSEDVLRALCYEERYGIYANTDRNTLISNQEHCATLGLLLDLKDHTLSFYNVDKETHLYTYTMNNTNNHKYFAAVSPGTKDSYPVCFQRK